MTSQRPDAAPVGASPSSRRRVVLRERADAVVRDWAGAAGVEYEPGARPHEWVVQLPGEHKLRTTASLLVGDHSLSVSAFVVRHPDEAEPDVHRWLLRHNARLRGVAFAIDAAGDVFLVGRLPLACLDVAVLDDLMGVVLRTADSAFDELLALGFATAIRAEWAWRTARGESTRNLQAFRRLLPQDPPAPGG